MSASSSGLDGVPTMALSRTNPIELAAAPFASTVPTVSCDDCCWGGLQDPNPSGGPWVRFGDAHPAYAGTSAARRGDAPLGRGYPVKSSVTIVPTPLPSAIAAFTGSESTTPKSSSFSKAMSPWTFTVTVLAVSCGEKVSVWGGTAV